MLTKEEFDQLPQPGHELEFIMKLALANTVRLPGDLYNDLVMRAEFKNVSVSQYVEELLRKERYHDQKRARANQLGQRVQR